VLAVLVAAPLACGAPGPRTPEPPGASEAPPTARRVEVSDGRPAMGTVLEIALVVPAGDEGRARDLLQRAFAEVERLESVLSTWRPESDASRLNRAAGQGPVRVHPDLVAVLEGARDGAAITGGAFDPTVGPLLALWREAARRDRLPSPPELAAARRKVGAHRIRLPGEERAELPAPGMAVDLGGIGKGYALDRVAALLREAGVDAALLSFGQSSVRGMGRPPGAAGWRLALRAEADGRPLAVTLRDRSLSVSSSLGQAFEIGGERFGHVVDPRSGQALRRSARALVVAPDATRAEVLSTALVVLPPARGVALVERLDGCEALVETPTERLATGGWDGPAAAPPGSPPHDRVGGAW